MNATRLLTLIGGLFTTSLPAFSLSLPALNPLVGDWHLTAFEQETTANPTPKFVFNPLAIKRITVTETSPGTLRLELKNAAGKVIETDTKTFTQDGNFFEAIETSEEEGGRERTRLGLQLIRDGLVLAHDIGGWFSLDDDTIWDGWSFAGVLTRQPLPRVNPSLWLGNFQGQEWLYDDDWNGETRFFQRESGNVDLRMDKTGATYRASFTFALDEGETDTVTLKSAGTLLTLDESYPTGEVLWDDTFSRGTLALDQGRYRAVQVSDTEIVVLGVEGAVARVSAKPPAPSSSYNQIDIIGSNIIHLTNTDPVYFEGQSITFAGPDSAFSSPFTATGLPGGLALNRTTGSISGQLTAKPGAYAIARKAGTAFSDNLYLRVKAFPSPLLTHPASPAKIVYAEHEALLRDPFEAHPVGKIVLTLAAGGTFTGTLTTNAPAAIPLRGRFAPASDGTTASITLTIPGSRTLALSLDASGLLSAVLSNTLGGLTLASAEAGDHSGRVALHSATTPAPGAPARGSTAYTLALSRLESTNTAPGGHGWATGTLATSGLLTVRGTLADGRPWTGSLRATSAGYLPYLRPYGTSSLGYLAGRLQVTTRPSGGHHITAQTGRLIWSKPAKLNAADRIDAFEPVALDVRMEPWTRLVTAADVTNALGLGSGPLAVALSGGIPDSASPRALPELIDYTVTGGRLTATVAAPVLDESSAAKNKAAWAKVWTLNVNLATGTFTGSFTLSDTVPPATRPVLRRVAFTGVMLAGATDVPPFLGHYVVPALNRANDSQPGAITLATAE